MSAGEIQRGKSAGQGRRRVLVLAIAPAQTCRQPDAFPQRLPVPVPFLPYSTVPLIPPFSSQQPRVWREQAVFEHQTWQGRVQVEAWIFTAVLQH